MNANTQPLLVPTPVGILCFPHLVVPHAFQSGTGGRAAGKPRYESDLLFPPAVHADPMYQALLKALGDVARAAWPRECAADPNFIRTHVTMPLRAGSSKIETKSGRVRPGYDSPGLTYLAAHSDFAPLMLDNSLTPRRYEEAEIWGGQTAAFLLNPVARTIPGSPIRYFVTAYLKQVQIVNPNMPRLGGSGGPDPAQFFRPQDPNAQVAGWTPPTLGNPQPVPPQHQQHPATAWAAPAPQQAPAPQPTVNPNEIPF